MGVGVQKRQYPVPIGGGFGGAPACRPYLCPPGVCRTPARFGQQPSDLSGCRFFPPIFSAWLIGAPLQPPPTLGEQNFTKLTSRCACTGGGLTNSLANLRWPLTSN